jgi:glyceraldehyde-3-phosphate dehydrogenase (NADP+)
MPAEDFEIISDQKSPPTYKFFNGKDWVSSTSGQFNEIKSPVDGSVVGLLPVVTKEEMDAALDVAKKAQVIWEKVPLYQRVKTVHLAADYIRHYQDYLISVMVMEIGKSYEESKSEINRTADLIDYYADEAQSLKGETLDSDNFPGFDKGRICMIGRAAYGSVLCIAPFNYPVNLSASKIAPALLMGNSVIIKPPTQGGISGLHLARIFQKAGVPEGVMVVLTGGGSQIGDYLVSHPKVSMVAFTGSSATGISIAGKSMMKPLLFECGGNNPAYVLPDADMKLTVKELIKGSFAYAGQRCTAIKYVLATPGVLEKLIPQVVEGMKELINVGDPRSPHTKLVGPVVSEKEAEHIKQSIDEAVSKGAKIVCGGTVDKAYVQPTVLTDAKPEMMVVACEIFGPVLSFIAVSGTEEAINIMNNSVYGLQACVFTSDEGAGITIASAINVGTVQINGSPQRGPDHFPFLGVKESGVGVQGVHYSLEAMSRIKPVVINKPS